MGTKITAKQKAARQRNAAVARAARSKSRSSLSSKSVRMPKTVSDPAKKAFADSFKQGRSSGLSKTQARNRALISASVHPGDFAAKHARAEIKSRSKRLNTSWNDRLYGPKKGSWSSLPEQSKKSFRRLAVTIRKESNTTVKYKKSRR